MSPFRTEPIEQLAHELSLAPLRQRARHLDGAARTLELIDPERSYPRAFVVFNVTGYRSRKGDETEIPGRDLIADLVTLIERLTLAIPLALPEQHSQAYLPATDVCRRWKISGKTLARWRPMGLPARWYAHADGPTLLFAMADVQRFETLHADRIDRARVFLRINDDERRDLAQRATALMSQTGASVVEAARAVAAQTHRSYDAVRQALEKFGDTGGASDHGTAIHYIFAPEFDHPDAQRVIFRDTPDHNPPAPCAPAPAGLPAYLRDLYRTPLLSAAQERDLFRRFNFLLHRAEQSRRLLDPQPSRASLDHVQTLIARATELKNRIVQANLRLVVAIARRHLGRVPGMDLFDLVSEGNVVLIRAVESFDISRGNRFSTYATWAVMRRYSTLMVETCHQRDRFQSGHEEVWVLAGDPASPDPTELVSETNAEAIVREVLETLAPREREIVERRFGFARDDTQTLAEISRHLNLSRERIRQIEEKSLRKLRDALTQRGLAAQFA